MSSIIQVKNLGKQFKDIRAVDDLSFEVPVGQVYGFLGQNGAGKSTTIRMLLTLIKPSEGSVEIFGMNLHHHRNEILRQVGAIIERPDMYKYLAGIDNLRLFATMSGIKVTDKILKEKLALVGLADRAHSKVKTYSQGMKQRLGIATALVHDPQLIILDEPTNGLDPQGIADVRNLVLHLSRDLKKTVVISSHLLHEMEMIADSMLIIDKGKKVVEGKVADLIDPADAVIELETTDDAAAMTKLRNSNLRTYILENKTGGIRLQLQRAELPVVLRDIVQMNIDVVSFQSKHSLEDYFLSLTSANQHVESFKN